VLELEDLTRSFGATPALSGLSLQVREGTICGFVGPNGAGKTTTMRIVLGVLEPDGGTVRWRGEAATEAARGRFGYMPEERGLYPKMPVADQLVHFARLHGLAAPAARRRVDALLERLGLAARAADRTEKLSLGNQQRVQLAAALVHDPELLVLDEPFSGLDPVGADVLADVLRERVRDGAAVLFSSHQLDLVERLCDDVAIVSRGRIAVSGGVAELRRGAGRRVRVEVLGAAPGWADAVPGATPAGPPDGDARSFLLAPDADEQRLLDAARSAGRVVAFAPEEQRLSELFREAVAA
jgi:ABC-2 type transport system ATP-binding protein